MNKSLPERIFICGFMGAGKSTTGKALANKLGQSFYDLDEIIEARTKQPIPEIFKTKGETGFRRMEQRAIANILNIENSVISLGGGSLQNQSIVDKLKSNGLLVFIEVPLPVIVQRVSENENRPMVWDKNNRTKPKETLEYDIKKLYEQRLPLYRQADVVIKGGEFSSVESMANQLKQMLTNGEV